jgi:hypothetical protein
MELIEKNLTRNKARTTVSPKKKLVVYCYIIKDVFDAYDRIKTKYDKKLDKDKI